MLYYVIFNAVYCNYLQKIYVTKIDKKNGGRVVNV